MLPSWFLIIPQLQHSDHLCLNLRSKRKTANKQTFPDWTRTHGKCGSSTTPSSYCGASQAPVPFTFVITISSMSEQVASLAYENISDWCRRYWPRCVETARQILMSVARSLYWLKIANTKGYTYKYNQYRVHHRMQSIFSMFLQTDSKRTGSGGISNQTSRITVSF